MSKQDVEKALEILNLHRDYIIDDVVSEWKNIEKDYKHYHQMVRSVYIGSEVNQGLFHIKKTISPRSSYHLEGVFRLKDVQVKIVKEIEIPHKSSIFIPRSTVVFIDNEKYDYCKDFLHSDFAVLEDIVIGILNNLEEKHILDKINTLIGQHESSLKILKTLATELSNR